MSANRPRVTAEHESAAHDVESMQGARWSTPSVLVSVQFDLHDHVAALAALDRAVQDVRSQIEETSR